MCPASMRSTRVRPVLVRPESWTHSRTSSIRASRGATCRRFGRPVCESLDPVEPNRCDGASTRCLDADPKIERHGPSGHRSAAGEPRTTDARRCCRMRCGPRPPTATTRGDRTRANHANWLVRLAPRDRPTSRAAERDAAPAVDAVWPAAPPTTDSRSHEHRWEWACDEPVGVDAQWTTGRPVRPGVRDHEHARPSGGRAGALGEPLGSCCALA
jgi:hypothetical protein